MKVNDAELYYEVHGEGSPLIFVHGWMCNISVWNSQVDYFSDRHKVIALDLRGHGRSEKPGGEYSIQVFSNDLYAFMRGLDLEKATIVGHSMGGMTALVFALEHPEMVSKLILVNTSAKIDTLVRIQGWVLTHFLPYKLLVPTLIGRYYHMPSERVKMDAFEMLTNTPRPIALKCGDEMFIKYDIRDIVSKIKTPTLIIAGENDDVMPVASSRLLNRGIEGSKLKIIPRTKHMATIDTSKEVNETIERYIN